jgi:hypothetical protein
MTIKKLTWLATGFDLALTSVFLIIHIVSIKYRPRFFDQVGHQTI